MMMDSNRIENIVTFARGNKKIIIISSEMP